MHIAAPAADSKTRIITDTLDIHKRDIDSCQVSKHTKTSFRCLKVLTISPRSISSYEEFGS